MGIAYHRYCTSHCLQNACERAESVLAILKVNLRKQLQQAPSLADGKRGARDDFLATPRLDADVVRSGVHFSLVLRIRAGKQCDFCFRP